MRLGVAAALSGGVLVPGDVVVRDGLVEAVGATPAGRGGLAVPGLVDLHVNGVGDVDLLTAGPEGHARAAALLAAHGVVAHLPTFVSAAEDVLRAALAALPPGTPGAHLEGPFLSPAFAGAHDPAHLRAPDLALAGRLLAAGPVALVTLAPELPGALELVRALAARGVVVSTGHSDATAPQAHAAVAAGARAVTHLHNAMRRFAARDPGPAGVALARDDLAVMAIGDGVHLADEALLGAARSAGPRLVLVSDLVGPRLGGRAVHVADGAARLADGRLAGGAAGLDAGVRRLVALGLPLAAAVHAASTAPARLLGRDDLGVLRPGGPAHVAVLDDVPAVTRTLVDGAQAWP